MLTCSQELRPTRAQHRLFDERLGRQHLRTSPVKGTVLSDTEIKVAICLGGNRAASAV